MYDEEMREREIRNMNYYFPFKCMNIFLNRKRLFHSNYNSEDFCDNESQKIDRCDRFNQQFENCIQLYFIIGPKTLTEAFN